MLMLQCDCLIGPACSILIIIITTSIIIIIIIMIIQAHSMSEARELYDQLAPLCPIMLALTGTV